MLINEKYVIPGSLVCRPEYKEALERPLINLDGTTVDVAAMYATPLHKSAPRTPEVELTTNEMFVNKTDGLDKNRNVNGGTMSPTGENGKFVLIIIYTCILLKHKYLKTC